jgi:hypothetical protein
MKPSRSLFLPKDGVRSEQEVQNPWLIAYNALFETDYIECYKNRNKCNFALVIR